MTCLSPGCSRTAYGTTARCSSCLGTMLTQAFGPPEQGVARSEPPPPIHANPPDATRATRGVATYGGSSLRPAPAARVPAGDR